MTTIVMIFFINYKLLKHIINNDIQWSKNIVKI